jgi:ketosteroid isomerase-like protein
VAAVTADWKDFLSEMRAIDLQFRDIEVTVSPGADFAYATLIERASLTPKHGAVIVVDKLRTTQIYEKRRDRWLIVHEHKSKSRTEGATASGSWTS